MYVAVFKHVYVFLLCVCVQESSLLVQQASLKGELEGNQQQVENFKVTKLFSSVHLRKMEFYNFTQF